MVALPDTHMPDTPIRRSGSLDLIEETGASPLKRALLAGLATAMVLAAFGIWVVPVDAGDTAMRLVKLVFSIAMLVLGVVMFSVLDRGDAELEIHLDRASRLLRIVETGKRGTTRVAGEYRLDDLSDITLRDHHLSARDARGEQIVSVTLNDRATESAIREALSLTA